MDDSKASEHGKALSELGAAKGGRARAAALDPEARREIARTAALTRWSRVEGLPIATHAGPLDINGKVIACAVLENKKRVLTQESFLTAIGRAAKAKAGTGSVALVDGLPPFLGAKNLKPFISEDLMQSTSPVVFRTLTGGRAFGYDAELLPKVCEVYLKARDAKALTPKQEHIAKACDILMRGLARVGIIALVDEATGFQADRAKTALVEILEAFIAKELRKWVKTFPVDYYKELFRLRGWTFAPQSVARPALVGKLTNNIVYRRLAPGVLDELKRLTPRDDKGRLRTHLHRRLTEDVGHPKLREHLAAVVALMKASTTWPGFMRSIDRALPQFETTLALDFGETKEE